MNRLFGLIPDTYGMANHLHSMLGPFVRDHRLCRMSDRGWLDQVQRPWKTSEQKFVKFNAATNATFVDTCVKS